jgi:mRNA (2'-O-methyladenosine-N6-)-methyltransferase
MTLQEILSLPIELIQDEGFIFVWTTHGARESAELLIKGRGYRIATRFAWFKSNIKGQVNKCIGKYFSHIWEECIVGVKGRYDNIQTDYNLQILGNGIIEERRLASQKPDTFYDIIASLDPEARCLDIFGRWINRRHNWTLFGNQTGHDDMKKELKVIEKI